MFHRVILTEPLSSLHTSSQSAGEEETGKFNIQLLKVALWHQCHACMLAMSFLCMSLQL